MYFPPNLGDKEKRWSQLLGWWGSGKCVWTVNSGQATDERFLAPLHENTLPRIAQTCKLVCIHLGLPRGDKGTMAFNQVQESP